MLLQVAQSVCVSKDLSRVEGSSRVHLALLMITDGDDGFARHESIEQESSTQGDANTVRLALYVLQ